MNSIRIRLAFFDPKVAAKTRIRTTGLRTAIQRMTEEINDAADALSFKNRAFKQLGL
jgi:hypothetical protein